MVCKWFVREGETFLERNQEDLPQQIKAEVFHFSLIWHNLRPWPLDDHTSENPGPDGFTVAPATAKAQGLLSLIVFLSSATCSSLRRRVGRTFLVVGNSTNREAILDPCHPTTARWS